MGWQDDSLFLCARPSFVEGISRLMDFGGTLNEYNRSLAPAQADYLALYADWRLIGRDWFDAIMQTEKTNLTRQ